MAMLAIRLIAGAIFIYAGCLKWIFWYAAPAGIPGFVIALFKFLSIVEPLAGLMIVAGLFTRQVSVGLSAIMVGAILFTQFVAQIGFTTQQGPGWNFPLAVLGGCLALTAFGAGSWSADAILKKKRAQ